MLREQGVPEEQLCPVAGGEYIDVGKGVIVRPLPGLHCLMPFEREQRFPIEQL